MVQESFGYRIVRDWFVSKGLEPFTFQEQTWQHIANGDSGLVNAPTGCGKTFSVFLGAIIDFINRHPQDYQKQKHNGLQLMWITPLRALAKDLGRAMEEVINDLGMCWKVGIRNGDTETAERQKQKRQMPEVLLTTPESLHLLIAQKGYAQLFSTLKIIAVDEWHELLGSKRGVQVELAISHLMASLSKGRSREPGVRSHETLVGSREPGVRSHETLVGSQESGVGSQETLVNSHESLVDSQGAGSQDIRLATPDSQLLTSHSPLPTPDSRLSIWGISATIGNLEEAKDVLLSSLANGESPGKVSNTRTQKLSNNQSAESISNEQSPDLTNSKSGDSIYGVIVRANMSKKIEVESVFPDEIEKYPWAGHLGIKLAHKIIPIILESKTTLIFINTRGMSETWYQCLLDTCPELAGAIALHHGSIDRELRTWIEEALHEGKLKAVVCTASLDLGVDFRPVETVIQVGSPKGVARFLQRAGRSGHSPDATSKIYFLPTHSLELVEAAALKKAMAAEIIESRQPMVLCYDVLLQWLGTLAISDGFTPEEILPEVLATHCFRYMRLHEWEQLLQFMTEGGIALQQYDEFKKVEIEDGRYSIKNRRVALRHRMHIGTIVSDTMLKVKFISGGWIGMIEEYFISRLDPGDVFTLAGRNLEFVMIKDMTALVRKSNSKKSIVPSWNGGRMPLSANLGKMLRKTFNEAVCLESGEVHHPRVSEKLISSIEELLPSHINPNPGKAEELEILRPLFDLQQLLSEVPKENELLIEQIETKDGFHLFVYPFEGRLVHEAMAAILAYRISRIRPISFSFAMNDYGFELLSDQPIPVDDSNVYELFSPDDLLNDIQRSVNSSEMARRKFRDIAVIGGLIFPGFPGEQKKARHLQASASLLFNVFQEYEPNNLLMRQAFQEVLDQQMEETRLRDMLERIQTSKIVLTFPDRLTPFSFPLKVDSMREDLSSEKLEDRVRKMQSEMLLTL